VRALLDELSERVLSFIAEIPRRARRADASSGADDPARDPGFFSRRRFVAPGPVRLFGRAWSGGGLVERVEVAVDGRWAEATLSSPVGAFGWRGWSFDWETTAGARVAPPAESEGIACWSSAAAAAQAMSRPLRRRDPSATAATPAGSDSSAIRQPPAPTGAFGGASS
jgi:hypothetical protein